MAELYHQLPLFVLAKVCSQCKQEKPLEAFFRNKEHQDGLASWCKTCANAARRMRQKRTVQHEQERKRIYQRNHPEVARKGTRRYYAKHTERVLNQNKAWAKSNPLNTLARVQRRRARKRNASVEPVNYEHILDRYGYVCHICEKPIDSTIKKGSSRLEFDHVIPLSRDGAHSEENIKPSHRVCNLRKHNKLLEEMTEFQRHGP